VKFPGSVFSIVGKGVFVGGGRAVSNAVAVGAAAEVAVVWGDTRVGEIQEERNSPIVNISMEVFLVIGLLADFACFILK